jgi:hypothetical protein
MQKSHGMLDVNRDAREFVEGKEGRRFPDGKTLGAEYNKGNLSL